MAELLPALPVAAPQLELRRFSQLAELPPEPPWLWNGFIAPGHLTMLAGHPWAGKSMLLSGLLQAMEEKQWFLGRETARASALLLCEEDETMLAARAQLFGSSDLPSEYLCRNTGVLNYEWNELIEKATNDALNRGHALLVIDTFPGLAGLKDEQENDAGAIAERLRPLQVAAGKGLAVLFLHHVNNGGQPRGSKAVRGVVDIQVRLQRKEKSRFIRLDTVSRYAAVTPPTLTARLIDANDRALYEPTRKEQEKEVHTRAPADDTNTRLRTALAQAGPDGLTYADLDGIDGLSRDIGKKHLPALYANGHGTIRRRGEGKKNHPYRWSVPA